MDSNYRFRVRNCRRQSQITLIAGRALRGYQLLAGTSPSRDKKGEPIASPLFSLLNRPLAADLPEDTYFDGFDIPTADIDIVKNGRLESFLVDFYIARKLGLPQTDGVRNFFVPPGNRGLDDIVAGTERGIILSRFSGGNPNSNLEFSGVAKNLFYIEGGEIRRALSEPIVTGQPAGFVAEHPGGFARAGQFRRPRLSVSGPLRSETVVIPEPTWVIKCVVKLRSTSRIATTRQGAPRRERSRSPSSSSPPRAAGGGQQPPPPRRHRRTHRDARRLCATRHAV